MRSALSALVAVVLALPGGPVREASARPPINVLWYTGGAVPERGDYKDAIRKLLSQVAGAPTPNSWTITFWHEGPKPSGSFNVLVVASSVGRWKTPPDYSALMAAVGPSSFGSRVMVTGQDADWHYLGFPGPDSFDGPQGFLIDAINWAGSGEGMGGVFLSPDVNPSATGGFTPTSVFAGLGTRITTRAEALIIPSAYASFPINEGLTSERLSNWQYAYHEVWKDFDLSKWTAINITPSGEAVTLVSASTAAGATTRRPRGFLEVLMDTTTLVATFGLLAFVERLTNGIAIVAGYSGWWRARMEVPATGDPGVRAQVDRNRRVGLFALSAALAVIGAVLIKLNFLAKVGLESVPATAGYIVTGLLIASGADPIREVFKLGDRQREAPAPPSPIQVTGTLVVQQGPPAATGKGEGERPGPTFPA